ncbi:DUF305 domain-containing protein [Kibdelosporangium lantanae]|uniref:DUF305 domain-containing protein n=1 Tax=Kibdelosporangium lantanae TaxID=1497396 RepID=A0ABW3MD72_9PSEU
MIRKILVGAVFAALATACSTTPDHNQADVTFAQQMVPHHAQALEMSKNVPDHTTNPKVRDLAARIQKAQDPEIQQLTTWLKAWGAEAAPMNHDSMTDSLKGKEFDTMWLQMMIAHHRGAVTMAKTELTDGGNADAKAMAQRIVDSQQAEVDEMTALL